ncbi:MAG: DUF2815 family protein [Oscillospiraceae bacterium]|jgi:hypothetical protein|nr:DUF2815 family protein [Oscillospiraceae bacterium]
MASATQIVTGKVRFSFLHCWEPYTAIDNADPRYSVVLLIPKSDKTTIQRLQAAAKAAREAWSEKNGKAVAPESEAVIPGLGTLHDGDGQRPNGDDFGPECKGCWVLSASSKAAPKVVDEFKNEILDRGGIKSGDYGKVILNAFAYRKGGNSGVSFGLNAIQLLEEGEALGSSVDVDDFDDEDF